MCGINGFNFNNQGLVLEMNRLTRHRGPDETNFWLGENISLGHNRLSIIDLSPRASQPMWDAQKRVVIVFNGEIYNFKELKRELEKKYEFQSESDTEVIIYSYLEYGRECVKKFNGIFAFAIWDTRTQELFLARDKMGVKPLYYYYDNGRFIFSSEMKAIFAHNVPRNIDIKAFNLYFQLLYIPEPHTPFTTIRKIPAASYAVLRKDNKLEIEKYWTVENFSNLTSFDEAVAQIGDLFKDSVRRQLISDRPVGIYLSGGMDSTAVLGAAREFHGGRVKTFSVGFKDSTDPKKFNADFELARKTAEFYNTVHHELLIGPEDVKNNLEDIAWHLDEPNYNPTAAAIFCLSRLAKKDVAVVLGGDGGDELFGGYPRYYFSRLISVYQKLPRGLRRMAEMSFEIFGKADVAGKLTLPNNAQRITAFLCQKDNVLSRVLKKDAYNRSAAENFLLKQYFIEPPPVAGDDFEKYFMNIDRQGWLVDESLLKTDRMSMAFGLEERVPILDERLAQLASRLPTNWKIGLFNSLPKNFQGKIIWKKAIEQYLPSHILNQKKRGWFTPMAKWLRAGLKETVEEIIAPQNLNANFFDAVGIQEIWRGHLDGSRYNLNIIWAIVMWQLWEKKFLKNY